MLVCYLHYNGYEPPKLAGIFHSTGCCVSFISVTALLMGEVYYPSREEPFQEPKVPDNRDPGVDGTRKGSSLLLVWVEKFDRDEAQGKI